MPAVTASMVAELRAKTAGAPQALIAADRARYVAIVDERVSAMERELRQALQKLDFLS